VQNRVKNVVSRYLKFAETTEEDYVYYALEIYTDALETYPEIFTEVSEIYPEYNSEQADQASDWLLDKILEIYHQDYADEDWVNLKDKLRIKIFDGLT